MFRVAVRIVLSALAFAPALPAVAATTPPPPFLVADLNRLPVESDGLPPPDALYSDPHGVEMNGVLYYQADDPGHGQELWRSDGTAAGTWRVSDVRPGPLGSFPRNLTVHQGRLYFTADDGVRGTEIWSTDGTSAGTVPLADLCPGLCSGLPPHYSSLPPSTLASSGRRLFFIAAPDGLDTTLWTTDGTRSGTVEILDRTRVQGGRQLTALYPLAGGRILFSVNTDSGDELWGSDGTPQGTIRLTSTGAYNVAPLGNLAVFWVHEEVWRTDGTVQGTVQVHAGDPHPLGPFLAWNGAVYYSNVLGQIWATDGTSAGTALAAFGLPTAGDTAPSQFTASSCGLLFVAADPQRQLHLWRLPGRTGPIVPVALLDDARQSTQVRLWNAGDQTFYSRVRAAGSTELWQVDGTSCQGRQIAELCGAGRSCTSPQAYQGAGVWSTGLFVLQTAAEGAELWRTDGTAAGTSLVRDVGIDPGSTGITSLTALGSKVLFAARTGAGPAGLWRSDGTAAGTALVKGRIPWPAGFVDAGGFLYFSAGTEGAAPCRDDGSGCQGLWRTDGTRAGTLTLAPHLFWVRIQGQGILGSRLLFSATDSNSAFDGTGLEPWTSDGTVAGTHQVADINQQPTLFPVGDLPPAPGWSLPGPAAWNGSAFLFAADDGLTGRELWSTDGTTAGTRQVLDIHPQAGDPFFEEGSDPGPPVRLGDSATVLFAADDGSSGRELWATDGTAPGTRRVRDLRPGAAGSSPHDLAAFAGKVWFVADDGAGDALWSSDGTEAGTLRVAPLAFGGTPSRGRNLTVAGSRMFLVVDNEFLGTELWKSDGTAAGTRPVKDIHPGPGGSYPQSLTAVDGFLVFAADDGTSGLEPWVSDGTPRGTRRLGDLAPGPDASSPGPFTAAGDSVFFSAWDPVHGRELWAVAKSSLRGRTPLP